MGTSEEGFSTIQPGQVSESNLLVQEANTETRTVLCDLENLQSHEKQDPDISSDEQELRRLSFHEFSVQEAYTEIGFGHTWRICNHRKNKTLKFHPLNLDDYPIMNFLFEKPILRHDLDVLTWRICNHMKNKTLTFHVGYKSSDNYLVMNCLFKKPILRQHPDVFT